MACLRRGDNNKTYNFFRFLLSCIVFAAVFPESLQALFMIQLIMSLMALSINSGRSPISRCMLGASLFSKIATSMVTVSTACNTAIVLIYKTPGKDGMLSLVKDFLAVVVLAEMDIFICPYVLQIANLLSDATAGECTPLGDQVQNLVNNCPLSNEEEKDRVQSFKQRTRSMVLGASIIFHLIFASSLLNLSQRYE